MKRIVTMGVIGLAIMSWPATARAQMAWTGQGYFGVNFGGQMPSHTLTAETNPEIYGEPASFVSSQDVGGGFFFDVSGGYKIWRNLLVGLGYTHVASEDTLALQASVPDQFQTDSPRAVSTSFSGAKHSQNSLHLMGTWMVPFTDKVDFGIQLGPTIFFARQDLPQDLQVQEPTPTLSGSLTSKNKTTVGLHFGVDALYTITPRYAAGVLARYTWGSVDFGDSSESLTLGGFQLGGGVRVRF
jgi:hypothetical protein